MTLGRDELKNISLMDNKQIFRLLPLKQSAWKSFYSIFKMTQMQNFHELLTHWGRVTHICVSKLTIIGSNNGLLPCRCQAIIWTNAGKSLIWPLGTHFGEILIKTHTFPFKKMHLKMPSAKCRPFCLGLNVLICDVRPPLMTEASSLVQWQMTLSRHQDQKGSEAGLVLTRDLNYTCISSKGLELMLHFKFPSNYNFFEI